MVCSIVLDENYFLPPLPIVENNFLLARLESAYSLIWGAQEILGKGGGETLALL